MPRHPVNPGWSRFDRLTFPPATRHGNLLFISGLTAVDDHGTLVAPGDIAAQARRIYELMSRILAEAGATFDDVVKTTDYITTTAQARDGTPSQDRSSYRDTAQVRRDVFGDDTAAGFPAATGVIVAGLLRPGALIEIDAIAVLDGG